MVRILAVVLLASASPVAAQMYWQPANPLTLEPGHILPIQPYQPQVNTYQPQYQMQYQPQFQQQVNPYQPRIAPPQPVYQQRPLMGGLPF